LASVQQPREHVAAEIISTEKKQSRWTVGAEQVSIAVDQTGETIGRATDEEPDGILARFVLPVFIRRILARDQRVDERPQMKRAAGVDEVKTARRRERERPMLRDRIFRRKEAGKRSRQINETECDRYPPLHPRLGRTLGSDQ
jgi:hypothetical protein